MPGILPLRGAINDGNYVLARPLSDETTVLFSATHHRIAENVVVRLFPEIDAGSDIAVRVGAGVRAAMPLRHPGIARLLDCNVDGTSPVFVVLEHVPGRSLRQAMADDGIFPLARAVVLIGQVGEALEAAHAVGITHGNLHPNAIRLTEDGKGEVIPKVLGFGWAHQSRAAGGDWRRSIYLAPEQQGDQGMLTADRRADQFSLAAIAYEMLAGCVHLSEESSDLADPEARRSRHPPRLAEMVLGLPSKIDDVLRKGLAFDPRDRFPSVRAFVLALRDVARPDGDRDVERDVDRDGASGDGDDADGDVPLSVLARDVSSTATAHEGAAGSPPSRQVSSGGSPTRDPWVVPFPGAYGGRAAPAAIAPVPPLTPSPFDMTTPTPTSITPTVRALTGTFEIIPPTVGRASVIDLRERIGRAPSEPVTPPATFDYAGLLGPPASNTASPLGAGSFLGGFGGAGLPDGAGGGSLVIPGLGRRPTLSRGSKVAVAGASIAVLIAAVALMTTSTRGKVVPATRAGAGSEGTGAVVDGGGQSALLGAKAGPGTTSPANTKKQDAASESLAPATTTTRVQPGKPATVTSDQAPSGASRTRSKSTRRVRNRSHHGGSRSTASYRAR